MSARLMAAVLAGALGAAPVQCAHKPDPDVRREDSPGDALWALAADFKAKGNEAAARDTLRFLVEKYPSNRHAEEARSLLGTDVRPANAASTSAADAGEGR